MTVLKLLLGRAGTGKSTALLRTIAQLGDARQQILIVPEQHSHDTERRLCAVGGNRVSDFGEVLSFTRLANRVFSRSGGLATPTLDAGGRLLLMYTALKAVGEQLKVYARPSRKPAFLTGLIATVDELKSCCVTPSQLWTAGENADGAEGDKLLDLSLIYGAYTALTAQQGADPRDRMTRLAEGLKRSRFGEGLELYLDGFTDFTPQELQVLAQLLAQAHCTTVALTCDSLEGGEDDIFAPARRTARTLVRMAREGGIPWTVETLTGETSCKAKSLAYVEANLFSPAATPWPEAAPEIGLFVANTSYSEVEWAAATILRLVREEGYRFREIAVGARTMAAYGDLIETIFSRYGIPLFHSQMSDILQKPVLALITAALETVAGHYQYEDIFRYLKTGLTGVTAEDCDLLENYALKWELRGSQWTAKGDWKAHPRGYGLTLKPDDAALLARLNEVRRQVVAPLERLRKNTDQTGRGQAIALYRFMEEIGLSQRLSQRTQALRGRQALTLAEEYDQLWDILCGGLEQCAQILGETPMEIDLFCKLFQLVLSQYDVGAIPVSLDRVTAGELPRLAHKHCRVLLLLGADDGSLPLVGAAPGLLNDDDRSLLASYGLDIAPRQGDNLTREMTTVYETCALPDARLLVSWAQMGAGGEEHRPSFLVAKLRSLFPNKLIQERSLSGSFRLEAPRPALELAGRFPAAGEALKALPDYEALVVRMETAAGLTRGCLTRPAVDLLYGTRIPMSASRMDLYKSCHFSYFMKYGLAAKPREAAGFHAPEYGTFVHYVLEHVLQRLDMGPGPWPLGDEERKRLRRITDEVVAQYVAEQLGGLEQETARFRYLFRRLLRSVYLVVENVAEELSRSDFRPIDFELGFGVDKALPPVELTVDGVTISVSGFVDRVDGWVKDQRLYLRVVDYKTGRKSFDLTDIWNGMGLQMLLYLFTLGEKGKTLYNRDVVPAGVLYLPARDAVIAGSRGMTEQERQEEIDKQLRRRGLVLNDPAVLEAMEHRGDGDLRFLPLHVSARSGELTGEALVTAERLGKLEGHIKRVLREITGELAAGKIAADPFWRGPEQNACQWCAYADACHFEEGRGDDKRRYLTAVRAEPFWDSIT